MRDLSECRVLIVDDTKANVDVLVETLRDKYKISVALNGEDALRAIARNKPDLVLLDIMMPGMDGYEVCARIKEDPETAEIPVVFISVLDEAESKTTGFAHGAVDYVTKPFDADEVKARCRAQLELVVLRKNLAEALERQEQLSVRIGQDLQKPLKEIVQLAHGLSSDEDDDGEILMQLMVELSKTSSLCDELVESALV
jgi:PleD family two-component response regulator